MAPLHFDALDPGDDLLQAVQAESAVLLDELGRRGGGALSVECNHLMRQCQLAAVRSLEEDGHTVAALIDDGWLVRAGAGLEAALKNAEDAVRNVVPGARLATKPIPFDVDGVFERAVSWKHLPDHPYERCVALLTLAGHRQDLSRRDRRLWERHPTVPGAVRPWPGGTFKDFANAVLSGDPAYAKVDPAVFKKLIEWNELMQTPSGLFPLLDDADRTCLNFRDGWLDMATCGFHSLDEGPPPRGAAFLDADYATASGGATPAFDKVVKTQLYGASFPDDDADEESAEQIEFYEFALGMLGRALLPVGVYDKFRAIPFLEGPSNTGKSTVLMVYAKLFGVESVQSLQVNSRDKFNLRPLHNAKVAVLTDVGERIDRVLPRTTLTAMSTGETVSLDTMYSQRSETVSWRTPIVMAGNSAANLWDDPGGSLQARFVPLPFNHPIAEDERDLTLEDRVCGEELPAVVIKMLKAYKKLRDAAGGGPLKWPRLAAEHRDAFRAALNSVDDFIANGSARVQCVHEDGVDTPLDEVRKAYDEHLKTELKGQGQRWTRGDDSPLTRHGFAVERVNLCKDCGRHATKAACGEHYDAKKRSSKVMVRNMRLHEE